MAIGRISGPLLKANLIRDGVDLAFETDLLYLDVNNSRIGVRSASPQYTLDVQGTTRSTNLIVSDQLNIGNFTVSNNTISSSLNTINFVAGGGSATAYHSRLLVNDIEFNGNTISTSNSNANLELRSNGTGIVDIIGSAKVNGNLDVTGNINATGNIKIDGNLIIGNEITDTITINASIKSDLIPETTSTYDLGSPSFRWNNVYAASLYSDTLDLDAFNVGSISMYDNVITTTSNYDLIIDANGTGFVKIGNFEIRDNTIRNFVSNSITEISQSGTGYLVISGTNGFVPPSGTTGERPTAYAVGGMMRYNTDSRALEIWDSFVNDWVSPAGTIGAVSEGTANDIAIRFALTLG